MARQFKFRYVNELVGSFVLLVIVLLVAGIILAGHYQDWFTPRHTVRITFPPEGSLGLRRGSEVEILQNLVGTVKKIEVDDDSDAMTGEIEVVGDDWFRFVRADSTVKVAKRYGVAGDAFLTITKGKGAPLAEGQSLVVTKDTELFEMANQLLNQVREATIPLLGQIRLTAEEYGALASDLRTGEHKVFKTTDELTALLADLRGTNGPIAQLTAAIEQIKSSEGPLMKTLVHIESIAAGLSKGEGAAGKLLRDPKTAAEVEKLVSEVGAAMAEVRKILDDVKKTTAQLPPMAAKVGREADDLPGLVLQLQQTLVETERLIDGVQKHWLIRGNITQPSATELIPPSEIGTPRRAP